MWFIDEWNQVSHFLNSARCCKSEIYTENSRVRTKLMANLLDLSLDTGYPDGMTSAIVSLTSNSRWIQKTVPLCHDQVLHHLKFPLFISYSEKFTLSSWWPLKGRACCAKNSTAKTISQILSAGGNLAEAIWQRQSGRGNLAEAIWHRQSGRGNLAQAIWQRQSGRGNLAEAIWQRQSGRDNLAEAIWRRQSGRGNPAEACFFSSTCCSLSFISLAGYPPPLIRIWSCLGKRSCFLSCMVMH